MPCSPIGDQSRMTGRRGQTSHVQYDCAECFSALSSYSIALTTTVTEFDTANAFLRLGGKTFSELISETKSRKTDVLDSNPAKGEGLNRHRRPNLGILSVYLTPLRCTCQLPFPTFYGSSQLKPSLTPSQSFFPSL